LMVELIGWQTACFYGAASTDNHKYSRRNNSLRKEHESGFPNH